MQVQSMYAKLFPGRSKYESSKQSLHDLHWLPISFERYRHSCMAICYVRSAKQQKHSVIGILALLVRRCGTSCRGTLDSLPQSCDLFRNETSDFSTRYVMWIIRIFTVNVRQYKININQIKLDQFQSEPVDCKLVISCVKIIEYLWNSSRQTRMDVLPFSDVVNL